MGCPPLKVGREQIQSKGERRPSRNSGSHHYPMSAMGRKRTLAAGTGVTMQWLGESATSQRGPAGERCLFEKVAGNHLDRLVGGLRYRAPGTPEQVEWQAGGGENERPHEGLATDTDERENCVCGAEQ